MCDTVPMPKIVFRILSTPDQLREIDRDFHGMIHALDGAVDATVSVVAVNGDRAVGGGSAVDEELRQVWEDRFGELEGTHPSEIRVDVRRYDLGSISGLTMHFAELLTERDEQPAEPILRQVADDAGRPRVPWHVEVQP